MRASFFIETYAFSCSVILPGQLIRKWLQERSILQPLYFCLCFPALKITPTELFQISETDFSPGCNFQVTWSTKKSYFSIVIASDPAWLTSPFPLSHQTTPCIEGMKGFSASFPAVCTQKGTPLRLILKRSALKVFGTGTYALLYTVICYDVPSFDFLLHMSSACASLFSALRDLSVGNRRTSRIASLFVSSMTRRSMP